MLNKQKRNLINNLRKSKKRIIQNKIKRNLQIINKKRNSQIINKYMTLKLKQKQKVNKFGVKVLSKTL